MTKTSIQEINAQCDEWQKTFKAYCKQYDQIMQQNQVVSNLKCKINMNAVKLMVNASMNLKCST